MSIHKTYSINWQDDFDHYWETEGKLNIPEKFANHAFLCQAFRDNAEKTWNKAWETADRCTEVYSAQPNIPFACMG